MTPASVDTSRLSHDAQAFKSFAAEAVDDGVHAAKRAIKTVQRRVEELGDLRDEAAVRVKRAPFTAVGLALGAGLALGMACGFVCGRFGKRTSTCKD